MKIILLPVLLLLFSFNLFSQCDPFYGDLVINEFMARNSVIPDQNDETDDWIEIHNGSDAAINLEGYFLSDGYNNRTKYQFPDTVIAAGGHIVVWADNQPFQEGLHAPFGLSGLGEKIVLCNPDTVVLDFFEFGDMDNQSSYGRYPNGHGPFRYATPSPGLTNNITDYRGLVINEFMALNVTTAQDEHGDFDDWIELYNNRTIPLNLGGYFLTDGAGNLDKYQFPEPTILGAGAYIIVWADSEPLEGPFHANFGLGAEGEMIVLSDKDTLTLDFVRFGTQIADISEGRFENGIGRITCLDPTIGATNSPSTVGVEEFGAVEFWAYPNPAKDVIRLKVFDNAVSTARIFDLMGKEVGNFFLDGGRNYQMDISGYAPGIYLLKVGASTKRIVIQ
jgi:hypothetical protein